MSDIPSMAIEKVHMYQNTSIMQDEVLSHRLGLLPLTADPRLFDWPGEDWSPDTGTEANTLQFSLNVRCTKGKEPGTGNSPSDLIVTRDLLQESSRTV